MENMYAYIDECGAYGFDFAKSSNSTMFIVVAILIKESDRTKVNDALEQIKNKEFSGNEIKSNGIKGNCERRVRILNKVLSLPFNILSFVVNKKEIFSSGGIRKSKKTFYKFINELLYEELRRHYPRLTIITDEVGSHEFTDEFIKYVTKNRKPLSLFDSEEFRIVNSKSINAVQLADLVAGTLSYVYENDKKKKVPKEVDFLHMLNKKLLKINFFPKSYDDKLFEHLEGDANYDINIASIAYRKATSFVETHKDNTDEETRRQVFILQYLLFRFKYNRLRRYISTKELIGALAASHFTPISVPVFRNKVIGKLRDKGVIISSSHKGYKLPSSEAEIYDYYQHVNSVVLPMISRLNKCNDTLKLVSKNNCNYLDKASYKGLHVISNAFREITHQPDIQ